MTKKNPYSKKAVAAKYGFRSGLEMEIDNALKEHGIDGEYEQHIIEYVKPETKGRFLTDDRKKHLLIRAQSPELDIRFLFQNSKSKISKGSKTTYADWCIKYGFKFADKVIPADWLE